MRKSIIASLLLSVAALFLQGCPVDQAPVAPTIDQTTNQTDLEESVLVITGNLFDPANQAEKNLSDAGMANLVYRMAETSDVGAIWLDHYIGGEWVGRVYKDFVVAPDGTFSIGFSKEEVTDGDYSIYCNIGKSVDGTIPYGNVYFTGEKDFVMIAGRNNIDILMTAVAGLHVDVLIQALPGRYESRIIAPGQSWFTDTVGKNHEMVTPGGSGQGIWKIGEPDQMICNSFLLPLGAELVSFSITDADGVTHTVQLKYDAFMALAWSTIKAVFPDTELQVVLGTDLRTPPTLNLATTGDGYMTAHFSPGNFDFAGGVWTYNGGRGTVAEGCEILVLNRNGGYPVSSAPSVLLDQMSFNLGYYCKGAGDISLLSRYDVRVVLDGETLTPGSDGWIIPAFPFPVDESGKKLPTLRVAMTTDNQTSFIFSEGDYVCVDGGWYTEAHYCQYFDTSYIVRYLVDGEWKEVTVRFDEKVIVQGQPAAVSIGFLGHYRGELDRIYYKMIWFDDSTFVTMYNGSEMTYLNHSWIIPVN